MINNKKKVFISATEQSGDNIGFNIINEINKNHNNIIFEGIGGNKMLPLLKNQFFSISDFKSIGIIEVLFSIKKYIKIINFLSKKIIENNYDLIITIDSPDFNYPLAKKIKKNNFSNKIIHIVAPSVWAWRSYRSRNFSKYFDELLALFQFEKKYFEIYNLKTTVIGHPIFYIKKNNFKINNNKNIAFLPGSRLNEIEKLFPYYNIAYEYLYLNKPDINIFIPTLPHLKDLINKKVSNWKINVIVETDLYLIAQTQSLH